MKRQISLDTETTGFDPANGDRIVEIGAVELIDGLRTGREFHVYINPERNVPQDAVDVHGLTTEFLRDQPTFAEIVDDLIDFLGEDTDLIAHNAGFDAKFLRSEFSKLGIPPIAGERFIDSLEIAKQKFPGAQNNLDALCRRFGISLASRDKHGALIDARLLGDVFLELSGGRQRTLDLGLAAAETASADSLAAPRSRRPARVIEPSPEELAAHAAMVQGLKNALWGTAA